MRNKEQDKQYYLKNKDYFRKKNKEWRLKNKEHWKEYLLKNKEHIGKVQKEYYAKNKEHIKQKQKEWKKLIFFFGRWRVNPR